MPLSAITQRQALVRLAGSFSLALSCLPQDDLSTYSRAWNNLPGELPASAVTGASEGAVPASGGANGALDPTPGGAGPGVAAAAPIDASAPDAGAPRDAGADAVASVDAGSVSAVDPAPVDAGGPRTLGDAGPLATRSLAAP